MADENCGATTLIDAFSDWWEMVANKRLNDIVLKQTATQRPIY